MMTSGESSLSPANSETMPLYEVSLVAGIPDASRIQAGGSMQYAFKLVGGNGMCDTPESDTT